MSESLIQIDVPAQMLSLARLVSTPDCPVKPSLFVHEIIDSATTFPGPGIINVLTIRTDENSCLIITALDVKTLYDVTDPALPSDFRATDDINPYGPFFPGSGGVGEIQFLLNGEGLFAVAKDIGVINRGVLFCVDGSSELTIAINPNQPAGKNLVLVCSLNCYSAPREVAPLFSSFQTRVITQ